MSDSIQVNGVENVETVVVLEKTARGEKTSRLVDIWTNLGNDASYDSVEAKYTELYPTEKVPSTPCIHQAKKKAFFVPKAVNTEHLRQVKEVLKMFENNKEFLFKCIETYEELLVD